MPDLAATVQLTDFPRDLVSYIIGYFSPDDLRNMVYAATRDSSFQWVVEWYLKEKSSPWEAASKNRKKDVDAMLLEVQEQLGALVLNGSVSVETIDSALHCTDCNALARGTIHTS
jgi:hypothetical protein